MCPPRAVCSRALLRAVIMGAPGAGKSTISKRIFAHFPVAHISCGDLLRSHILRGSVIGKEASRFISAGQLVPDDIVTDMMLAEVEQIKHKSWLLDGYPRTIAQAKAFTGHYPLDICMEIDVPFEVIEGRLSNRWVHLPSGRTYSHDFHPPRTPGVDDLTGEPLVKREDDKLETLKMRWENYLQWEKPMHNYFDERELLTTFTGRETNKIWPHVYAFLSEHLTPLKPMNNSQVPPSKTPATPSKMALNVGC